MKDGNNGNSHSRRRFLNQTGGAAAAATGMALAGCTGGNGDDGVLLPGIYDLSGATSDVGRPTGIGSRDAIEWLNENGDLDEEIDHDWHDYAYEVPEAQQQYDGWTQGDNPPAIIGWGTADTEALADDVAFDEIVYVSASYSDDLMAEEFGYNFYVNLDYTSQCRVHLEWIAEQDSDATVAFIHNTTPFGETVVPGGEAYAEELDLTLEDNIALEPDENDASTQVQRAEDNDVDYLIHQNTAAPMQVLLSAIDSRDADITVCGTTWTTDELRAQQEAPELFEGVRYVNSNFTFAEAQEQGADGWEIIEDSFEREDRDMDDPEVASVNYVRGVVHALVAYEGIRNADDPRSGASVREALFELDDFDGWGLLPDTINYEEGDRRPTMAGRMYEVQDAELVYDDTVELERNEGWIPPFEWE